MRQTISPHPTPNGFFLLAPRIWEPRDQPQPGSCRSERGGVAVSGDKTLGTRLVVCMIVLGWREMAN